jgi:hypothetical protein
MTPIDYIKRFTALCNQYHHQSSVVWAHCGEDDHQALCDELENEWAWFEQCLKLWQRQNMTWCLTNKAELPVIGCKSCYHYTKESDWCGKHNKTIPATFDKTNACKGWNL